MSITRQKVSIKWQRAVGRGAAPGRSRPEATAYVAWLGMYTLLNKETSSSLPWYRQGIQQR